MFDQRVTPTKNLFIFSGTLLWLAWFGWLISPAFFVQGSGLDIEIKSTGGYCSASSHVVLKPIYPALNNAKLKH